MYLTKIKVKLTPQIFKIDKKKIKSISLMNLKLIAKTPELRQLSKKENIISSTNNASLI